MNCSSNPIQIIASILIILAYSTTSVSAAGVELPGKSGLAAAYPGDIGIDKNPAVVFTENFEKGTLDELFRHWTDASNKDAKVLAFSTDVPAESVGKRSLQITATRGHDSGGHLFKVISPGQDRLFVRFYARFAPDYGFCHHFVRIRGMINPVPFPVGQVSKGPSNRWCGTDVEPVHSSEYGPSATPLPPPGIWTLSSYWPDMRSWQGPGGTSFYPNKSGYSAENPIQLDYERWHSCVMAVKLAADRTGSMAVWIDGTKLCEYENIKTCANTNPSITQITMGGTIAQPAYDAPAHYRKFDALLLTDNWQNIIDIGYLKKNSGSVRD